ANPITVPEGFDQLTCDCRSGSDEVSLTPGSSPPRGTETLTSSESATAHDVASTVVASQVLKAVGGRLRASQASQPRDSRRASGARSSWWAPPADQTPSLVRIRPPGL